jgi:protoporphyrin/coproporphyrin ferrochelatase
MSNETVLTPDKKTAVVLFQLGGPDSLEAVEPFLYNLFMDPDIIDFPGACIARRSLAACISKRRSPNAAEKYRQIGGKSPILDLTQLQASSLESALRIQNINAHVFIAMRYWHPMVDEVVQKIKADRFEQIILLPLYPQFSKATTVSSINEWERQMKKQGCVIPTKFICCYPIQPRYIEAIVENINSALVRFPAAAATDIDLIFSAHSVPLSFIKRGDPYQLQIEETVRSIIQHGKWNSPHTLCYQSKVGPMKWLKPSLIETIEYLAGKKRQYLLVIPISFVTDHIETLHEINIEAREHAVSLGIQRFEVMPALNDHPAFIHCLLELVQEQFKTAVPPRLCETLRGKSTDRSVRNLCPWIFK